MEVRFPPPVRELALRVASEAIAEQREALRQSRDRSIAVADATTAAGTLLMGDASPGDGSGMIVWAMFASAGVGLVLVLTAVVQVLRPREFRWNLRASTLLGWVDEPEPDAELAMHEDRRLSGRGSFLRRSECRAPDLYDHALGGWLVG